MGRLYGKRVGAEGQEGPRSQTKTRKYIKTIPQMQEILGRKARKKSFYRRQLGFGI